MGHLSTANTNEKHLLKCKTLGAYTCILSLYTCIELTMPRVVAVRVVLSVLARAWASGIRIIIFTGMERVHQFI